MKWLETSQKNSYFPIIFCHSFFKKAEAGNRNTVEIVQEKF